MQLQISVHLSRHQKSYLLDVNSSCALNVAIVVLGTRSQKGVLPRGKGRGKGGGGGGGGWGGGGRRSPPDVYAATATASGCCSSYPHIYGCSSDISPCLMHAQVCCDSIQFWLRCFQHEIHIATFATRASSYRECVRAHHALHTVSAQNI